MAPDHTIVVGGGIVGICAAYFLARRGARVTLLEQETFDDGASTGNAGLVAAGHGPLPRPGLAWKALRWIGDPLSPLHISPRPDLARLRWLLGFHHACRTTHHEHCLRVLAEHGRPAGECFRALVAEEAIACEFHDHGQLDVYLTAAGLRAGEDDAKRLRGFGYGAETVGGDELRRREPAFRPEVVGATLFTDRAFACPRSFVVEMAERARRRGAELRAGAEVTELIVEDGRCRGARLADGERLEADAAVLAAGVWSSAVARRAGVHIPMQAGKGYHVDLQPPVPALTTASVCAEAFVAATPMGGGLRLAGTLEFSGINHRIVERRVDMLAVGASRYLHGIEAAPRGPSWCGLRPCTADGLPVIGWAPRVRNLFIATGHAMMGFALGPLAGRLASECVLDGQPSVEIGPFSAGRFEGKGPRD